MLLNRKYEMILDQLEAKDEFLKEVKKCWEDELKQTGVPLKMHLTVICLMPNFQTFLASAFRWRKAVKKEEFWMHIAVRGTEIERQIDKTASRN